MVTGNNRRLRWRTFPSAILPTTNSTWSGPGSNLEFRVQIPAMNLIGYYWSFSFDIYIYIYIYIGSNLEFRVQIYIYMEAKTSVITDEIHRRNLYPEFQVRSWPTPCGIYIYIYREREREREREKPNHVLKTERTCQIGECEVSVKWKWCRSHSVAAFNILKQSLILGEFA